MSLQLSRKSRPNILFIMADQMATAAMPVYGHRIAKAPHLMSLVERGVVFDNAYCAAPLCAPSRYTMLTGRLPAAIGAYDNAADFPSDLPTFAHYLRLAGYRTALAGKMHICGADQLHGFEERLTTDIYPADYGWTPDWEDFQTRPSWYHNMLSVTQAGPCLRSNQLDFDEEVAYAARRHIYDSARGADARPFCLAVSFTHPHDPYAILPRYWNLYEGAAIDPPVVTIAPEDQDPHARRLRHVSDMDRTPISAEQVLRARRAYYGSISFVDDQVGMLLAALADAGLAHDTIVVFTGDHGDMLGERGLWYKMCWYEGAARVPLIVAAPRAFRPHRVREAVSLIDLLPTLAEIAGDGNAPNYATPLDGRSLLPHLGGTGGHDEVLGEYLGEGAIAPLLMIRRGRWKYVCSAPDPDQLFDLEADPHERTNLATHPAHRATVESFRAEATRRWDSDAIRGQVIASQRRRRLVYAALKQGAYAPWDFQPRPDASRAYVRNNLDLDDIERRARFPAPV
jgi:choline-sulfatase